MKKTNKALLLVLCAILLVVGSVMGTLAYLTSTTDVVKNTFTAGNVEITLDEAPVDLYGKVVAGERVATNKYKLIPGHTYAKDPTIHVDDESENCWVFAKLENGLGANAAITIDSDDWKVVATTTDYVVYAYQTEMKAGESATLFNEFTFAQTANPADYTEASITIIGYAIQSDGFATPEAAWAAAPKWTNN